LKDLIPIEHNSQRIMFTFQLAEFYKTDDDTISQNFRRNPGNFILGEDYYVLQGAELKQFKAELKRTNPQIEGSFRRANILYLWTEYGALMHAKSLQSDRALEVFRELRKAYFVVQQQQKQELPRHQFNFKYQERLALNKNVRVYGYIPVTKFLDDINIQFLEDVIVLSETSSPDISIGKFLAKRLPSESWYKAFLVRKPVGGTDRREWDQDIVMTVYVKDGYQVKREVTFYPLEWYPAIWHIMQTEYFPDLFPKYLEGKPKGIARCSDEKLRKYIAERVNYFSDEGHNKSNGGK
jgi:hypothetical protein